MRTNSKKSEVLNFIGETLQKSEGIYNDLEKISETENVLLHIFEHDQEIGVYITIGRCFKFWQILRDLAHPHTALGDRSVTRKKPENIDLETMRNCFPYQDFNDNASRNFKSSFSTYINENDANVPVENIGIELRDLLLPENIKEVLKAELQSDNHNINNIWVFCGNENTDCLWEWIYWENATEGFFWGDRFHICRIPNDIAGKTFKKLTCNIENGVTIIDPLCTSADIDRDLFKSQPNWVIIKLQSGKELDKLKKLGNVDYIHVVISVKTIETDSNQFNDLLSSKLEEFFKKREEPKFLFLNIRGTGDNQIIGKFKKIFTDKVPIWIDTNLDLKDDDEISFTQNFYKILKENREREITEVVTEARNTCNSFCRLAYIIKGSPHTTIILGAQQNIK